MLLNDPENVLSGQGMSPGKKKKRKKKNKENKAENCERRLLVMQSDLKLPTFGRMGGAGHTTSYINGPERGRFVL